MTKVLLLNPDNEPLRVCSWRRALVLLLKGKATCAEYIEKLEDFITIDSTQIPKIIKLNYDMALPFDGVPFNRENILIRDNYTCQYCGRKLPESELTLDHVYPKSRKGPDMWENIVACCKECNQYKANRTPKEAGMKLLRRPFRPDDYMEFEFLKYPKQYREFWLNYLVS
ncbi:HNH endonuclease [bacterium]|nr:HNH endonuclease [bacterium]